MLIRIHMHIVLIRAVLTCNDDDHVVSLNVTRQQPTSFCMCEMLGGLVGDRIGLVPERVRKVTDRLQGWINLRYLYIFTCVHTYMHTCMCVSVIRDAVNMQALSG